jgi:hypothetical protein
MHVRCHIVALRPTVLPGQCWDHCLFCYECFDSIYLRYIALLNGMRTHILEEK